MGRFIVFGIIPLILYITAASAGEASGDIQDVADLELPEDFADIYKTFSHRHLLGPHCGPTGGGQRCPRGYCCSKYGYCGKGKQYCRKGCRRRFGRCARRRLKPNKKPTPKPPAQQPPSSSSSAVYLGTTVGSYHYYAPGYDVNTVYCADAFRGKSQAWLRQYPWTAYCLSPASAGALGGMRQELCGSCIRLTNQRTGTQLVARIVDQCGNGALDMDWDTTFKPLDTDGQGYLAGRMAVKVESIAC